MEIEKFRLPAMPDPVRRRLWQRIVSSNARRTLLRRAAAGLAAAAAGLLLGLLLMPASPGPIRSVRGRVQATTEVVTGPAESGTVELVNGIVIDVAGDTRVRVSADARHVIVERGDAGFRVPPQKSPFAVLVPGGRIRVVGTQFHVNVAPGGQDAMKEMLAIAVTTVVCTQGSVVVEGARGAETLRAGFVAALAGQDQPAPAEEARVRRLIAELADDSPDRREAARAELLKIGAPALPVLRKALEDKDAEVRALARILVGQIERAIELAEVERRLARFVRQYPDLVKVLAGKDADKKALYVSRIFGVSVADPSAPEGFPGLGPAEVKLIVKPEMPASDEEGNLIVREAVRSSPEDLKVLATVCQPEVITTRSRIRDIVWILTAKECAGAVRAVHGYLLDRLLKLLLQPEVVDLAGRTENFPVELDASESKAVGESLLRFYKDADPQVRIAAIPGIVGFVPRETGAEILVDLLKSGIRAGGVDHTAAHALAGLGVPALARKLLPLLKEDDAERRILAIDTIAAMNPELAREALVPLLKDDAEEARQAAALALARCGARAGVDPLMRTLKQLAGMPVPSQPGGPPVVAGHELSEHAAFLMSLLQTLAEAAAPRADRKPLVDSAELCGAIRGLAATASKSPEDMEARLVLEECCAHLLRLGEPDATKAVEGFFKIRYANDLLSTRLNWELNRKRFPRQVEALEKSAFKARFDGTLDDLVRVLSESTGMAFELAPSVREEMKKWREMEIPLHYTGLVRRVRAGWPVVATVDRLQVGDATLRPIVEAGKVRLVHTNAAVEEWNRWLAGLRRK